MTDWLQVHEKQVEAALAQIQGLRKERAKLEKRVGELEKALSAARGDAEGAGRWEKDRRTLKQRVRRLADGLEKALG
ncbi:MAG: hypothetical protein R2991_16795 [Thermoanaerobaculia bacterium]